METQVMHDPEYGNVVIMGDGDVAWDRIRQHPEVAAMFRWAQSVQGRRGGIFERDRFVQPTTVFDQMDAARYAAEHDDVVSGLLDALEAVAFTSIRFDCDDPTQEDLWNQLAGQWDLEARFREMWRELMICSQFVCFPHSGETVLRRASGRRVTVRAPLTFTWLHPRKVVPAFNSLLLGREILLFLPDTGEVAYLDRVIRGEVSDDVVTQMVVGRWTTEEAGPAAVWHQVVGSIPRDVYLMRDTVWRHTLTRAHFEPFAAVRMKSIFPALDLKQQLMEADRAHLVGASNFIVLITKGSDERPATPREVRNLRVIAKEAARIPIIVGDHRLHIEIITPKIDMTLNPEKYTAVNTWIAARLLQTLLPQIHTGREDTPKMARVLARQLEARRSAIRNSFLRHVVRRIVDENQVLTEVPRLNFYPKHIAFDFDNALANFLIDLRDRGELSRSTTLSEFDFDQDEEAQKLLRERAMYDTVFQTVRPFVGNAGGSADENDKEAESEQLLDRKSVGRNRAGRRTGQSSGGLQNNVGQGKTKEQQR